MDKQDAIDYIIEEFEKGFSTSEIAQNLSRELNAPVDIVARFVDRTLEKRIAQTPPPAAPSLAQEWGLQEDLTEAAAEAVEPTYKWELPAEDEPAAGYDWGIPTEETDSAQDIEASTAGQFSWELPAEESEPEASDWAAPAEEPESSGYSWEIPLETDAEAAPSQVESFPSSYTPPAIPIAAAEPAAAEPPTPAVEPPIDPKLEQFILKSLSGDKKRSDLVMTVCERTGLDWPRAERLIGRVEARNRKKITTRRNLFLIPFALVALLAGIGLTAASLMELQNYLPLLQSVNAEGIMGLLQAAPPMAGVADFRYLLGMLITGVLLVFGGGIGLFRSVKSQLE